MSDKMYPIPLRHMLQWCSGEYSDSRTLFGIPREQFYIPDGKSAFTIFGEGIETPLGPAAGPHTQLTQNILTAYLCGGRFFELKTVQKLDQLEIDKPCIDARDEGYNVEWSQELTLDESYDEYLKAWFLLHLLPPLLGLSKSPERGFVFNMSVGYDLAGIQTPRMDRFIEELKDASASPLFSQYRKEILDFLDDPATIQMLKEGWGVEETAVKRAREAVASISPNISHSVTLSTMHGCPPQEIEAIARYLLQEKKLHTYVKLNPTLLGFDTVNGMLHELGYGYMELDPAGFEHDLQYRDALPMLQRLQQFAAEQGRLFGVKLSNTLGMKNRAGVLPGEEMYMSGRSLFPLTINLAARLSEAFNGKLPVSYSGGATQHNIRRILDTGIYPVTVATDLLKPGGYGRLSEMARLTDEMPSYEFISAAAVGKLAEEALQDPAYQKAQRAVDSIKISDSLPLFDCYLAPCQQACPIHQDVAEYVRLVEEGRHEEAFEVIVARNPLPHITGYICDHQCQHHCTRWDYDRPVEIRALKRAAADSGYAAYMAKMTARRDSNGIPVAVVGAGPAGLAAAVFLARSGFAVTVFDKAEQPGGTVQNVIPPFRLPEEAIGRDIDFVQRHGVEFQFGVKEELSVQRLKEQGYRYIFLGIGAGKATPLPLRGEHGPVLNAVEFLARYRKGESFELGKRVAVIGGGNSAMDGARAALRFPGVEAVTIVYRRTVEYMPADREEYDAALADGIQFRELLLPVEFQPGKLVCQKMALGEVGNDGRRGVNPLENEFETLETDTVIAAIGERVDRDWLQRNGIALDERGRLRLRPDSLETSVENVFIGGDALRGPSTVVESMADGKAVAEEIIRRELGSETASADFSELIDADLRQADIVRRKSRVGIEEAREAAEEAARCLGCNLICNKCVDVCPNRANVALPSPEGFRNRQQILHLHALCNECGNCATFCPYQGAPYKDKLALYWSREDFDSSENDGFLPLKLNGGSEAELLLRFRGQTGKAALNGNDWDTGKLSQFGSDSDFRSLLVLAREVLQRHRYLLPDQVE